MEEEKLQNICYKIKYKNPSVEEVRKELLQIFNRGRLELGNPAVSQKKTWQGFYSPLVFAVESKRKDLIKLMIKDLGFDIDSKCDNFSNFALTAAIKNNDEEMVRFLVVEMKAKVNINQSGNGRGNPLIFAIDFNRVAIVKLLVEELGAEVNFKLSRHEDGSKPYLPLHVAIYQERK
jgi:ankyrin repeat protein